MVHFTQSRPAGLFHSAARCMPRGMRITPFGNPGVAGYVLLTPAYRSLSRPSSPCSSKASAINLYSLDHIIISADGTAGRPPRTLSQALRRGHAHASASLGALAPRLPSLSCQRSAGSRRHTLHVIMTKRGKKEKTSQARRAHMRRIAPSLRKEVIQPHLPVRLPCYDFTPLTKRTFDSAPLAVRLPASGTPCSDGVTGGVYKARERIHRAVLMRDY